jgi:tartrate/fumarate subfamily iron-sulfur-dependent hydro-lyase beta chain
MDVKALHSPLTRETARSLHTGDMVRLTGRVITARDQVHKLLSSGAEPPVDLTGLVLYHCGPVAVRQGSSWKITAAGPTTSIREEPYEADIISRLKPGAIMGKGGMGERTLHALAENGCVYLHVIGGAASYLAGKIVNVADVHLLEFGQPEAMWVFDVSDMPALVTMDSHGKTLHASILRDSAERLESVFRRTFKTEKQD